MNSALKSLIDRYDPKTKNDWENALREIIQEIALLGLYRAKFFEHAAFYGGTALRIFYGLRRFSEDMDFSLLKPNSNFDLSPYLEAIRTELAAFDFDFEVQHKQKNANTGIESGFLKGGTRVNLLIVGAPESLRNRFVRDQKLKIKLEVDVTPPAGAEYHVETLLIPIPFQVKLYSKSCLFAGKLHAVLCRAWQNRAKGRDFYDLIWYVGRGTKCHLGHLQKRMEQTGHWNSDEILTGAILREKLRERIDAVDFGQAKEDVFPFVADSRELDLWGKDFFYGIADRVEVIEQEERDAVNDQKPDPPKEGEGQFWIANTGKCHKPNCQYVRKDSGRYGAKSEGIPCRVCRP